MGGGTRWGAGQYGKGENLWSRRLNMGLESRKFRVLLMPLSFTSRKQNCSRVCHKLCHEQRFAFTQVPGDWALEQEDLNTAPHCCEMLGGHRADHRGAYGLLAGGLRKGCKVALTPLDKRGQLKTEGHLPKAPPITWQK